MLIGFHKDTQFLVSSYTGGFGCGNLLSILDSEVYSGCLSLSIISITRCSRCPFTVFINKHRVGLFQISTPGRNQATSHYYHCPTARPHKSTAAYDPPVSSASDSIQSTADMLILLVSTHCVFQSDSWLALAFTCPTHFCLYCRRWAQVLPHGLWSAFLASFIVTFSQPAVFYGIFLSRTIVAPPAPHISQNCLPSTRRLLYLPAISQQLCTV